MSFNTVRLMDVSDPGAMRALAHGTRLRLLGLLRTDGPLTATEAGQRIGESASSCSYHLRQLARHGFVEEAGPRKGRTRPWRATAQLTRWSEGDYADQQLAAAALDEVVIEQYFQRIETGVGRRLDLSRTWRDATTFGDYDVHVTAAELRRLTADVATLIEPYLERTVRPRLRPRGSRRVMLIGFALPADP